MRYWPDTNKHLLLEFIGTAKSMSSRVIIRKRETDAWNTKQLEFPGQ